MFEIHSNSDNSYYTQSKHISHAVLLNQAIAQFNQARWDAIIESAKCALLRRAHNLLDLAIIPATRVRSQHHAGFHPVDIKHICGSLGRTGDFDHHFHPLDDRIRDRWVSIAIARGKNLALAPVELIQVGSCYFVKDGHHRLSVARALGEAVVDAEITIWEVCGPLPWEKQPVARVAPQTA